MTEDQSDLEPASQSKRRLTIALSIAVGLGLLAAAACARPYLDRPAARPQPGDPAPESTQSPSQNTKLSPTVASARANCQSGQTNRQEAIL